MVRLDDIRPNREQFGLSQRDLADHLGVAVETISRWENGVLTQTRAMDSRPAGYLGVPAARAALVKKESCLSLLLSSSKPHRLRTHRSTSPSPW